MKVSLEVFRACPKLHNVFREGHFCSGHGNFQRAARRWLAMATVGGIFLLDSVVGNLQSRNVGSSHRSSAELVRRTVDVVDGNQVASNIYLAKIPYDRCQPATATCPSWFIAPICGRPCGYFCGACCLPSATSLKLAPAYVCIDHGRAWPTFTITPQPQWLWTCVRDACDGMTPLCKTRNSHNSR